MSLANDALIETTNMYSKAHEVYDNIVFRLFANGYNLNNLPFRQYGPVAPTLDRLLQEEKKFVTQDFPDLIEYLSANNVESSSPKQSSDPSVLSTQTMLEELACAWSELDYYELEIELMKQDIQEYPTDCAKIITEIISQPINRTNFHQTLIRLNYLRKCDIHALEITSKFWSMFYVAEQYAQDHHLSKMETQLILAHIGYAVYRFQSSHEPWPLDVLMLLSDYEINHDLYLYTDKSTAEQTWISFLLSVQYRLHEMKSKNTLFQTESYILNLL